LSNFNIMVTWMFQACWAHWTNWPRKSISCSSSLVFIESCPLLYSFLYVIARIVKRTILQS